eukprot:TRINITY_DN68291_c0_g1_i1.p1 TRINITY_DN68291_c0_g1~~TRINITY_DN68291_c0_g1_i1.p1  ORF type:complete len:203 (-),score=49.60 TRINITY_DN68291_c0_g1_i1:50-658(-)
MTDDKTDAGGFASLCLVERRPSALQLQMKPVILSVSCLQGVVALWRIVLGDFCGALIDILAQIIGLLAALEMKSLYYAYYGFACCVSSCMSFGTLLVRQLYGEGGPYGGLDMFGVALLLAAANGLLGALVNLMLWRDSQSQAKADSEPLQRSAQAVLSYGAQKAAEGPVPEDPFLLENSTDDSSRLDSGSSSSKSERQVSEP